MNKKALDLPAVMIRQVAMPQDINSHGAIFGGWLMSQMDLAGTAICREFQKNTKIEDILTVKVIDLVFNKPVYIGDIIECWTDVVAIGTTSITIEIVVNARRKEDNSLVREVAKGIFKYVNTIDGSAVSVNSDIKINKND